MHAIHSAYGQQSESSVALAEPLVESPQVGWDIGSYEYRTYCSIVHANRKHAKANQTALESLVGRRASRLGTPLGNTVSPTRKTGRWVGETLTPSLIKDQAGIDWLEWGGEVEWWNPEGVVKVVEDVMQAARAERQPSGPLWVGSGKENQFQVQVSATGFKGRFDGLQWYFFTGRGIKVSFSAPGEDGRSRYVVECGGEAFLNYTAKELLPMVHSWLKSLGLRVLHGQNVRRFDLAWDLFSITMADLAALWPNRVTLARGDVRLHAAEDGEGLGSIYLGHRRGVQVNVYDKLAKIEKDLRSEPERALATLNKHCGAEVPESWVRCEFRWSGASIRDKLGTSDLQEVLKRRGELAHYSVHKHLRFADGPVDRENRNQSKAETHPVWKGVQAVAVSELEAKPLSRLTPEQVEAAKTYRVKRAAAALSSVAVALLRHNADGDALGACYETVERVLEAFLTRMPPELLRATAARAEALQPWSVEECEGPYKRVPLPDVERLFLAVLQRARLEEEPCPF